MTQIQHKIVWDRPLELGVIPMDQDHHHLVDLMNEVYDACARHQWDGTIEKAMADLSFHTVTHFNREEALMQSVNYPGFKAHLKAHQRLTSILDALCDRIIRDKAAAIDEDTVDFLKKWLLKHIHHSDLRFAKFYTAIIL
jgi:hemerythrin